MEAQMRWRDFGLAPFISPISTWPRGSLPLCKCLFFVSFWLRYELMIEVGSSQTPQILEDWKPFMIQRTKAMMVEGQAVGLVIESWDLCLVTLHWERWGNGVGYLGHWPWSDEGLSLSPALDTYQFFSAGHITYCAVTQVLSCIKWRGWTLRSFLNPNLQSYDIIPSDNHYLNYLIFSGTINLWEQILWESELRAGSQVQLSHQITM